MVMCVKRISIGKERAGIESVNSFECYLVVCVVLVYRTEFRVIDLCPLVRGNTDLLLNGRK